MHKYAMERLLNFKNQFNCLGCRYNCKMIVNFEYTEQLYIFILETPEVKKYQVSFLKFKSALQLSHREQKLIQHQFKKC